MSANIESACRFRVDRRKHLQQYTTVFQRPIQEGYDALPVGNGDLAAVVWQPNHLTWMLNKCDLSGEASQAARLVFETPTPLAQRAGRLETRLSLADATVNLTYTGGEFGRSGRPAVADVAFSTTPPERFGVWRGVYGRLPNPGPADLGTLKVCGYIPEGRNTLLIEYAEETEAPHPTTIVLERWIQKPWGDDVRAEIRGRTAAIVYRLKSGLRYAAVLAFDGFEGATFEKSGPLRLALKLPGAAKTRGRLAIAVVTSIEANDPLEAATRLAEDTLAADPAALRRTHEAFWSDFWGRFFVDAGHPYANALYHMALYELGITSRGRRPVKFNGALNLWNERERVWGEGYTFHNQHSAYIPVYAANHVELADNFHDWIARVRPEAVKSAREIFGIDGAFYPEYLAHEFTPTEARKFVGSERDNEMTYILSTGVRACLLLWDRYRYTLDEAFLRKKAHPVFRDVAELYVNYGKLGRDGRYHVEPSLSWEERPLGRDGHADCAAWRAIFAIAIESARILGEDRDRAPVWAERLRKAPPFPMHDGLFSVVMRKDGTPESTNHFQWQLPNLSGVYPYGVIGMGSSAAPRKTAEATFDRYRFNADAGHEYLPVIAARLGRPDWWRAALFQYIQFFQAHDQGLFNYYDIFGNKDEDSSNREQLHPYLEASGIFAAAVNEMLIQGHAGVIRVFPAVPERWHGRFILRAPGSFLVASEHRGRQGVPYIIVQAAGGDPRTCRVAPPWQQAVVRTAAGRPVPIRKKGQEVAFRAEPETVYVLTPKGTRLEKIPLVTITPRTDGSPARLGAVWYGNPEGANCHTASFPLW